MTNITHDVWIILDNTSSRKNTLTLFFFKIFIIHDEIILYRTLKSIIPTVIFNDGGFP